ncbi:MAG TPA: sulfite exporter TauE/SafE family protein [Deltaproteobacteria bacterium]|nr:sulfite exporter TauE/SafE family protein [Deltaproteobacteria bacterium]HQI02688.1 sulfite exporter TauE/SafE family protein [Deltaproteobacteria bacterium]
MAQGPGIALLIIIGLGSGIMSGMFGIGGGIIIVPALVYLMGFSQHEAIGTSLAILLPPVGLGAVLEYYRHGNVDLRSAIIVALGLFLGAWLASSVANRVAEAFMRLAFGVFVTVMGVLIILNTLKKYPLH